MIRDSWAILIKDLQLDLKRLENFFSMLFFTITILLIFAFALPQDLSKQIDVLAGMYWISFLLSGILSLNKSFQHEKENGCIHALLISPVGRGAIFLGKMFASVTFILIVQGLVIPIFGILFNFLAISFFPELMLLSLLASLGFASLGTLLAGLTSDIRFKEILLPLLLFPLLVPLLLACVRITQDILGGSGLLVSADWVRLLVGFDLIFLIIAYLTFEFVMEL
ncbi:MAG: heme exporter protein CcmB [Proteobacteria bacterium]|nr:heme exporter protein CcmB [Pseudomonadota bacterium]